ncbi:probable protein phosphatase 2C 13 [Mercurialis annua]|uniref:probable protein phosphatase 2C 13 n=1 Tax=Mercurialis annua TaxID=3986 RepID=UPI00215E2D93|nr:probable protein phosphatase 2C 13 [Mercurialis annua]
MIVSQKLVAEPEIMYKTPIIDVQYHLQNLNVDVSAPSTPILQSLSADISRFESAVSRTEIMNQAGSESSTVMPFPRIRSGSYADIGTRPSMDDEHIQIDDLSAHLGSFFKWPSSFYGVFDGHGGPEAAAYIKRNAMRYFFEDAELPCTSDIDTVFLEALVDSHRKAFLLADVALADESSVSSSCGTTALTALVIGRHLVVANVGDCRAVLCKKGIAVDMSQDHRPSYLPERKRVEELGGYIEDEYLNGYLSVTRALGDWDLKLPLGAASPLIAEPEVQKLLLTEDDEFLIIGCDGIWDVISSQNAVSFVRRGLRRHDDPELCARELVMEAARLNSTDNLTVVIICFSSPSPVESCPPQRRRLRCCGLSEEARNRLKSLLEGN